MFNKQLILSLIIICLLPSCGSLTIKRREYKAENAAELSSMRKHVIDAGMFFLTSWHRVRRPSETINIYIEGDGLAWISKKRVSTNPTPKEPLALELATRDRSANVIYIARPCQYTGWKKDGYCSSLYWTHGRTAPEVIESFMIALDKIKMKYGNENFTVTGYSGGAAVAAILTARRDDIIALRTVAGNTDYETFTTHHNVSPLFSSIDPISVAYEIRSIPQIHFIGEKDKVVPSLIFNSWDRVSNNTRCIKKYILNDATHNKGWIESWDRLQFMKPECY